MGQPKGAVSPRRLNVTSELMADVRRRYEHTDEALATMAADFGCCIETVRNIAKRENWTRHVPPPRDLTRAAKLRIQTEALAEGQGEAAGRPPPETARSSAEAERTGGDHANAETIAGVTSSLTLPLSGGGDAEAVRQETGAPPPVGETARELHRELLALLADVKTDRERMKREGYAKHQLQEISRTIASLSDTLRKLDPMLNRAPQTGSDDAYDDIPADLDEFREALARRIEAFMESRADEEDAFAVEDDGPGAV